MPHRKRYIALEFNPYLPWNRGILKGIEAFAQERTDWHLLLHRMLPGQAVMIWGTHEAADGVIGDLPVQWARDRGIPQVCFNVSSMEERVPLVYSDFRSVGKLAALHLIECGYEQLASFTSFSESIGDIEREEGFHHQTTALNVPVIQIPLPEADENGSIRIDLKKATEQVSAFRNLPRPTGFFARNLAELYLAHQLITESGLTVPNDIGLIVGGNDRDMMEALKPSVTGISRNTYGIGYRAAETLQRLFDGKPVKPLTMVPPGGVIDRGSTRLEALGDEVVRRARELIRKRISGPLKLGEIARGVGVSESSLRRRFHATLHHSPIEEIQRVRIDHARMLLEKSTLSVSEVSEKCGYAEPAQLSRAIKAATGLTPTQFRSHALRQNSVR